MPEITAKKPRQKRQSEKKKQTNEKLNQKSQKPVKRSASGARILQTPKHHWYNPATWRYRPPVPEYAALPKARIIFWTTLNQLWDYKTIFGGIILTYGLFNLLFVRGLSGSNDLSAIKSSIESAVHGISGNLLAAGASFTYLLASSGSGSTSTSGVYQVLLIITCSLAYIWALRQILANNHIRIRDSFYRGMYPLIPFVLVFLIAVVQLLPLAIAGLIYSTAISDGIVVNVIEKLVAFMLFLISALWSLRMVTATIFAFYIVTLPDMTPLKSYRSARGIVYGRRLLLWRKIIFLPIVLLLIAAAIEIPLIYFATAVAEWAFFVVSMIMLPLSLGYLYNLYREMI